MLVAVLTYVLHACTFLNHYGHLCVLRKLVSFSTTLSAGKLEIKKFGIKNETWFTVALLIKTRRVVQPRLHSQNFFRACSCSFFCSSSIPRPFHTGLAVKQWRTMTHGAAEKSLKAPA